MQRFSKKKKKERKITQDQYGSVKGRFRVKLLFSPKKRANVLNKALHQEELIHWHKLRSNTSTCGKQRTTRCLLHTALTFDKKKKHNSTYGVTWGTETRKSLYVGGRLDNKSSSIVFHLKVFPHKIWPSPVPEPITADHARPHLLLMLHTCPTLFPNPTASGLPHHVAYNGCNRWAGAAQPPAAEPWARTMGAGCPT